MICQSNNDPVEQKNFEKKIIIHYNYTNNLNKNIMCLIRIYYKNNINFCSMK